MVVGCCLSVPRPHSCGTIIEKRGLETSFNSDFLVDYCPKCEVYSYRWGAEDKIGIVSKDEQEIIGYVEKSQEIIKQKHLENLARMPSDNPSHIREMARVWAFREKHYPSWTKI